MRAFVTSVGLGVFAGYLWLLVWGAVLRTPLIIWFKRTPEKRALRQQRFIRMGRLRDVLLVGVLGSGFAFALGMTIAGIVDDGAASWGRTIEKFIFLALAFGCFQGSINWDTHFRNEVSFPPPDLPK